MFKKIFLFSGLSISLLLVLECIGNSIVNFIAIPSSSVDPELSGMALSNAIWFLVVGIAALAALVPALIIAVIRIRNGKSLIAPLILLAASSLAILLAIAFINGAETSKVVETYQKAIADILAAQPRDIAQSIQLCETAIATSITRYVFSFFAPLTACAFSVLSFFDFDKGVMPDGENRSKKSVPADLGRIKAIKELYDAGALDEEEFKELKKKELASF